MTTGFVAGREPRVEVSILLADGRSLGIEFVVDTGFSGYLTLPPAATASIGLPFLHEIIANFADDRSDEVAVHEAVIFWRGAPCLVEVLAKGRRPLLGTMLLQDSDLHIRFQEGGVVSIVPV